MVSAKRVSAFLTGPSGRGCERFDGLAGPAVCLVEGLARDVVLAEGGDRGMAAGVAGPSSAVPMTSRSSRPSSSRGILVGQRPLAKTQQRQRRDTRAQVGAGGLARLRGRSGAGR